MTYHIYPIVEWLGRRYIQLEEIRLQPAVQVISVLDITAIDMVFVDRTGSVPTARVALRHSMDEHATVQMNDGNATVMRVTEVVASVVAPSQHVTVAALSGP